MKCIEYTIRDALGIHARPAGMLVKEASKFTSEIRVRCKGKEGDAKKILSLMGLAAKEGDRVEITVEGPDEEEAAAGLERFMSENL